MYPSDDGRAVAGRVVELFRHRPSLAAELLSGSLGVKVPEFERARVDSGDLTDLSPTEYRADAVVTFTAGDVPVLTVVVEAQLSRDRRKRRTWPVYVTTLHARFGCPAALLVVCADKRTARWCGEPIEVGHPGFVLRPLVVGPERVPVVTDAGEAVRSPELAVLSAMTAGSRPEQGEVFRALLAALESVDHERAGLYADVVLAALPEAARHHLEAMMVIDTYEYQSEFARRYFGQGKAEGEAEAVLAVLDARGVEVPTEARDRIAGCTDLDELETWVRRAATATSVDDLFA